MVKRWKSVFSICTVIVAVAMLPGCCSLFTKGEAPPPQPTGACTVTVNYDLSLKEMIRAGKYDRVCGDISDWKIIEGNPADRKGQEEVRLKLVDEYLYFNNTEEVLKRLDEMSYRPATVAELLAFGAKYPGKQKGPPIVALGSVFRSPDGNRRVAYFDWDNPRRCLDLHWARCSWPTYFRFLAVRK